MLNPRDPEGLSRETFDLIVVGGGVHGIMVALEAIRRRLRPLLVERRDFGSGTSQNSLRIVHGGLRYLQSADLVRFRESVAERRWFLRHFADFVQPLPCLAPLHGEGLHRPSVLRAALWLNDALSWRRNAGVRTDRALPGGRVLGPAETQRLFPGVDRRGLRGGALWYDAFAPNTPRLLIEALHWACGHGALALNYVEAKALTLAQGRVAGLMAVDTLSGAELTFRAPLVINAAGPWSPRLAADFGAPHGGLFDPSLAWNLVFRRPPLSRQALAVKARRPGAQTYFLAPWKGVLLAGTGHAPWHGGPGDPVPTPALLRGFIANLNEAVPGLDLSEGDVARVFAGLLPATEPGGAALTVREVIVDHHSGGGPAGFFSLAGIKLTTARRVADKVLRRALPSARPLDYAAIPRPPRADNTPDHPFDWMPAAGDNTWKAPLQAAIAGEAVQHLDDLLLRRSSLGDNPQRALALAREACGLFAWDPARASREVAALRRGLGIPGQAEDANRHPDKDRG